jgi:hypothetical protein
LVLEEMAHQVLPLHGVQMDLLLYFLQLLLLAEVVVDEEPPLDLQMDIMVALVVAVVMKRVVQEV